VSLELRDLEREAERTLGRAIFDYFAGGAEREVTLQRNVTAWGSLDLRPHVLRGIDSVATEATVLGTEIAAPILVAPIAYQLLAHSDGEVGTAKGIAAAGGLMVVSTRTTMPLEEIAAASQGSPLWFQVYLLQDRSWIAEVVARAREAGYRALVLTADTPILGRRKRDERNSFQVPPAMVAAHHRAIGSPSRLPGRDDGGLQDPRVRLEDIGWLREQSGLPVVVKGVLRADDAHACVEAGAEAVVVSNHGGRQLDSAVPTAAALPEVVAAVGSRAEVYVDGGIREGADILKALALGAQAVLIGRPIVWGLAALGGEGVRQVLEEMREALARAMVLCQVGSVGEISADLVGRVRSNVRYFDA
jgi:4-hydroxymandelate oxidase